MRQRVRGSKALACFFLIDFHCPDVISGLREGVTVMYHPTTYPHRAVGQVLLLWQPGILESLCKVWIWCLPVLVDEITAIIDSINGERRGLECKVVPDLLRFRLIGPRSHLVITSLLSAPPIKESLVSPTEDTASSTDSSTEGLQYLKSLSKWDEFSETSWSRGWWVERVTVDHAQYLRQLYDVSLESCDVFSNGTILSLVSCDPRLTLPVKRGSVGCPPSVPKPKKSLEKLLEDLESELNEIIERGGDGEEEEKEVLEEEIKQECKSIEVAVSSSWPHSSVVPIHLPFIWDESIRQDSSSSRLPDHMINDVRGKYFIKPEKIDLENETSVLPLMMIKREYPDTRLSHDLPRPPTQRPLISGWDMIFPSHWGMSVWISLVYRGARPLSYNELNACCHLECPSPLFPRDYPDTVAGQREENEIHSQCSAQYGRYPPDKRPNFGKLRITSPFRPRWAELVDSTRQVGSEETSVLDNPTKKLKMEGEEKVVEQEEEEEEEEMVEEEEEAEESMGEEVEEVIKGEEEGVANGLDVGREGEADNVSDIPFYVLREPSLLKLLEGFKVELFANESVPFSDAFSRHGINQLLSNNPRCLVTVVCEVASHGKIVPHSLISLPTSSDISSYLSSGGRDFIGPCEPLAPRGLTFYEGGVIFEGVYSMNRKEMKELKRKRKKAHQRRNRLKGGGESEGLSQEEKSKYLTV